MIGNQYQEYHTNVTPTYEDATYFQYHIECVIDGALEYSLILNLDL